jgi:hypothetical protein
MRAKGLKPKSCKTFACGVENTLKSCLWRRKIVKILLAALKKFAESSLGGDRTKKFRFLPSFFEVPAGPFL